MTQPKDNLILNSPFEIPSRYFDIVDGEPRGVVAGRRLSDNLMPVPPPKKRGPQQMAFVKDKVQPNEYINRVSVKRRGGGSVILLVQISSLLLKKRLRLGNVAVLDSGRFHQSV